jgi:acetyl-CoA carboxylase carboxyl transferase subunit beta
MYLSADMAWWSRTGGLPSTPKKSVPKGVWTKCDSCGATLYESELDENSRVCKHCGYHFRLSSDARMALVMDEGSFREADIDLVSNDPLEFRVDGVRYRDQLKVSAKKAESPDAYRAGSATVGGYPVEIGFFIF